MAGGREVTNYNTVMKSIKVIEEIWFILKFAIASFIILGKF